LPAKNSPGLLLRSKIVRGQQLTKNVIEISEKLANALPAFEIKLENVI